MSDFKAYKEQSRSQNWGTNREGLTENQIKLGCMLRIADATEAIATEHNRLIEENKQLKESRKYYLDQCNELYKTRTALKGQVTKLKNKLDKEGAISFACYLLDHYENYFPGGEEEIQLITHKFIETAKEKHS